MVKFTEDPGESGVCLCVCGRGGGGGGADTTSFGLNRYVLLNRVVTLLVFKMAARIAQFARSRRSYPVKIRDCEQSISVFNSVFFWTRSPFLMSLKVGEKHSAFKEYRKSSFQKEI